MEECPARRIGKRPQDDVPSISFCEKYSFSSDKEMLEHFRTKSNIACQYIDPVSPVICKRGKLHYGCIRC